MWYYNRTALAHYGVLGMKWGVRKEYKPVGRKVSIVKVAPKEKRRLTDEEKKRIKAGLKFVGTVALLSAAAYLVTNPDLIDRVRNLVNRKALKQALEIAKERRILSKDDLPRIEEPHSIAEDAANVNPNLKLGEPYQYNCSNCVSAYELRRRGFNVEAAPIDGDGRYLSDTVKMWQGAKVDTVPMSTSTTARVNTFKNAAVKWGNGARGVVASQGSYAGHIFSFEIINGEVTFIESQNGRGIADTYTSWFDLTKTAVNFWRTDNLPITEQLLNGVIKKMEGGI